MPRLVMLIHRCRQRAILVACAVALLCAVLCALTPLSAAAQETTPPPPKPQEQPKPPEEARSTGLPSTENFKWKFNFDASWGNFGFLNSLYANAKPDEPATNLGDNWFEGAIKPALSLTYTTASSWQVLGKVSAVGERTYGGPPTLVGDDASSFKPEDLSVTVQSGKAFEKLDENAFQGTIGRAPFQLGHGFLLYDGSSEGGTRGGYWTNARKAFKFAAVGRFQNAPHKAEVFYLEQDSLPEVPVNTKIFGVNYEASLGKATTIGATYMNLAANIDLKAQRNGLNVYDLRAYSAPFPNLEDLSFEFEYAREDNGPRLDSHAWTAQGAYQLSKVAWKPKISYRYAFFEGDDPATPDRNEAWDPLLPGFYDWGTWWQGEIAGEYFVSNSNLISHEVRIHTTPTDKIGTGLIFFDFLADKPQALGPLITARDVAFEMDWYMDWKLTKNITMSAIGAYANPGQFVQQVYDRTKSFFYGMLYFAYSY
jgi:Alginate export